MAQDPIYINCGGAGDVTATDGRIFVDDDTYKNASGDNFGSFATTLSGATNWQVFKTERWDHDSGEELEYLIPVETGTYSVELWLAEQYGPNQSAGKRVFHVLMEGVTAFARLDIYAEAGNNPLYKTHEVAVGDGTLNIRFQHTSPVRDNPLINGIVITPVAAESTATLLQGTTDTEGLAFGVTTEFSARLGQGGSQTDPLQPSVLVENRINLGQGVTETVGLQPDAIVSTELGIGGAQTVGIAPTVRVDIERVVAVGIGVTDTQGQQATADSLNPKMATLSQGVSDTQGQQATADSLNPKMATLSQGVTDTTGLNPSVGLEVQVGVSLGQGESPTEGIAPTANAGNLKTSELGQGVTDSVGLGVGTWVGNTVQLGQGVTDSVGRSIAADAGMIVPRDYVAAGASAVGIVVVDHPRVILVSIPPSGIVSTELVNTAELDIGATQTVGIAPTVRADIERIVTVGIGVTDTQGAAPTITYDSSDTIQATAEVGASRGCPLAVTVPGVWVESARMTTEWTRYNKRYDA